MVLSSFIEGLEQGFLTRGPGMWFKGLGFADIPITATGAIAPDFDYFLQRFFGVRDPQMCKSSDLGQLLQNVFGQLAG